MRMLLLCLSVFYALNAFAGDVPKGCKFVKEVCTEQGATREIDGIPVYEPCWNYQDEYSCPDWSTEHNSCDDITNCTEQGSPVPVTPWEKQATYVCEQHSVEKVCKKYQTKKECSGSNDYANGNQKFTPVPTKNFSKAMSYMSMLDAIGKSESGLDPLQIFKGDPLTCVKPLHLGPFGNNCCDINVSERGSWYQNHCSANELKLGVSRRSKDSHFVGSHCIQHMPFPLQHVCVKERQGYCAFPSMMARIIQEQGREQINQLAQKGSAEHNSLTQSYQWKFTDKTAHWNQFTINGVKVASFTSQALSQSNAPIWASFSTPVKVENNSSSTVGSVSVSLNCQKGQCQSILASMGTTDNNQFDPTCNQVPLQSWSIGQSSVAQGQCVPIGSMPIGWKGLTWDKSGNPSFWKFNVQTATPEYLTAGDLNWTVNHKQVTGTGSCSTAGCNYNLIVDDNGDKQSGNLSFPFSCTGSNYQTTIDDITFGAKCTPQNMTFAICTTGSGCGSLPVSVSSDMKNTGGWEFFNLGMSAPQKFLTRNISVGGQCSNNNCVWSVTSLGENGYQDVVTSQTQWNVFAAPIDKKGNAKPDYAPEVETVYTTGGLEFRPYQYSHKLPPTDNQIKVMYRLNVTDGWQTSVLPINIPQSSPITLGSAKVWGRCDLTAGMCAYSVSQSIKITDMPWGTPDTPLCNGFTPAELQLINFSKIDLSEYTNQMKKKQFTKQKQQQMAQQAKSSSSNFKQQFQSGGGIENPAPQTQRVVSVSPTSGVGGSTANPFTVTLWSATNFPKYYPFNQCRYPKTDNNTNPVSSIAINWGDGTPVETISAPTNITQKGFEYDNQVPCDYTAPMLVAKHTYAAPPNKTVTLPITVQLMTKNDGMQTTTVDVQNIWQTGNNLTGVGQGGTVDTNQERQANTLPESGEFNPKEVRGLEKYN